MPRRDDNARIDLAELGNLRRWERLITAAKAGLGHPMLTEYERTFLKDMIHRTENDRPLWNPNRKQYNLLHTIVSGL